MSGTDDILEGAGWTAAGIAAAVALPVEAPVAAAVGIAVGAAVGVHQLVHGIEEEFFPTVEVDRSLIPTPETPSESMDDMTGHYEQVAYEEPLSS